MVSDASDLKPSYNPSNVAKFGPAVIEKRTDNSSLRELGTSFMEFTETGASDPWTLRYEETIYVIAGHLELQVLGTDPELTVVGQVGDLLVLPEGTSVRYCAEKGTRLLLSITPANWRNR
ncbi:hypothetical protein ABZ468_20280 [Streptomyces sp. NPDC005708]|uniref:hypothetical protein n=1 Tax=Streptomyces sp. NPDC005708 TaxID=3154564 RepID=UPI0033C49D25